MQAAPRFLLAQNACQQTKFSCSGAVGLSKLVFNVQTAYFKAGKPISSKICPSQEQWKSTPAFSVQLPRHSPKFCPACLSNPCQAIGKTPVNELKKNTWMASPPYRQILAAGGGFGRKMPKGEPAEGAESPERGRCLSRPLQTMLGGGDLKTTCLATVPIVCRKHLTKMK